MFEWMAWTLPVAVFFSCIVLMLVGMTVWEIKSPTTLRKGWLPMATTRGDRLFIGLLLAAYVNLVFVGLGEDGGGLGGDVRRPGFGERAELAHQVGDRHAVHELHDLEQALVVRAEVVQDRDAGVLQQSATLPGTFEDVQPVPTSPYTPPLTATAMFYRLRE